MRLCSKVIADRPNTVVIVSHWLRLADCRLHVVVMSVPRGHSLAVSAAKVDARLYGKGLPMVAGVQNSPFLMSSGYQEGGRRTPHSNATCCDINSFVDTMLPRPS
jgi:hypothetical protein